MMMMMMTVINIQCELNLQCTMKYSVNQNISAEWWYTQSQHNSSSVWYIHGVSWKICHTSGKHSLGKSHQYNQNTYIQIWMVTEIMVR